MPYGVDVSNVNGPIHWQAVARPPVEFAHVKASEGISFRDPNLGVNIGQARAAGLHVGPYHFGRPDHHPGSNGARAEAQFFVSRIGKPGTGSWDMRPVLDLETGSGILTPWAGSFLAEVQRLTGVRPLLYTYTAFARAHLSVATLAGYGLWLADYGPNDGRQHPTAVPNIEHQFTSRAVISGIVGHADENFAPSLAPLLITPIAPPKPPPVAVIVPQVGESKNDSPFKRLWPVPLPAWFWTWAQWRVDGQTYERPADAPTVIPPWAWVRLRALKP